MSPDPRTTLLRARRLLVSLCARLIWPNQARFQCPVCGYYGPFRGKVSRRYRLRRTHAKCPNCRANERTRLQYLVIQKLLRERSATSMSTLHVAPEPVIRRFLKTHSSEYWSADLTRSDVDLNFDLQSIPFPDASLDLVYASHVLVYVPDDIGAMQEMVRVLKPGGLAVIPVPITAETTEDNDGGRRFRHEPGLDYPDRMREVFARVELYKSGAFDACHQLFVHEYREDEEGRRVQPYPRALEVSPDCYEEWVTVCVVQENTGPEDQNASGHSG